MKILKGLTLSLLGFLLFLSLSIFSLAFMLNSTILNPNFITSELNRLDVSSLVEEVISEQPSEEEFPAEFKTALIDTITKLEPLVKEQVSAAIYSTFDYLLGKSQSLDLAFMLRNTILSSDFVTSLIDKIDLASLAGEFLSKQIAGEIPEEMEFLSEHIDDVIAELEPAIKKELIAAADPILDYLLGESQSLNVVISLEPIVENLEESLREELLELPPTAVEPHLKEFLIKQVTEEIPPEMEHLADYAITDEWVEKQVNIAIDPVVDYLLGESQSLNVVISLEPIAENLEESLREEFLESPPPEYAGLPQTTLEQYFDEYFQKLAGGMPSTVVINESTLGANIPAQIDELFQGLTEAIPATFELDESMLGTETPAKFAEVLAKAEKGLEQGRQYVGYFQLGYKLLIGFMLLLILGIILISRQVRDITRRLGIPCLTYGVLWYASIFVGKYLAGTWLPLPEIPSSLRTWIPQFLDNFLAPLEMFSLGLLIVGIALIIVSFVYKPRQPSS